MSNIVDFNELTKVTIIKIRDFLEKVIGADPMIGVEFMPPIYDFKLRTFCLGAVTGAGVGVILDSFKEWAKNGYRLDRNGYQNQKFNEFLFEIESGKPFATLKVFYDNGSDWVVQFVRHSGHYYLLNAYVNGKSVMDDCLSKTATLVGTDVATILSHWDNLNVDAEDILNGRIPDE